MKQCSTKRVFSLLRRISILFIISKHLNEWMNETQLNGWNWSSVNWNLLFSSTRYRCSLKGFQQNSGSYFAWLYCQNHRLFSLFFLIQSDTLFLLVPTITTFVRRSIVCLFVHSFVLTWVICIKINIWNVVGACTNQHQQPLKYTNRLGNLIVMTHIFATSDFDSRSKTELFVHSLRREEENVISNSNVFGLILNSDSKESFVSLRGS